MSRVDQYISELRQQANNGASFDSFQAQGYQDPSFEVVQSYLQGKGATVSEARNGAADAIARPGVMSQIKAAMSADGMVGSSAAGAHPVPIAPGNVSSAAQFTINVKRVTAAINQALPFALFNPIDAAAAYKRSLSGLLPTGVTITKVAYGVNAGLAYGSYLELTYNDGVNTDTIVVTCSSIAYPSFLLSLVTDKFAINKVRMNLSDPSQLAQFDLELTASTYSMFGLGATNTTTPSNFKSPQQYQAGIVDVDLAFKFDKQTALTGFLLPVAGFSVAFNFFSPRFDQQSARYW